MANGSAYASTFQHAAVKADTHTLVPLAVSGLVVVVPHFAFRQTIANC